MTCALKNRGEFKAFMVVQDGWYMDGVTRTPRMVASPFRMAKPCQFQLDDKYNLPDCVGCSWKTQSGARAPV